MKLICKYSIYHKDLLTNAFSTYYKKKYLSGNPVTEMKRRERGVFTQKGESLLLF